jgi:hypothetical protein
MFTDPVVILSKWSVWIINLASVCGKINEGQIAGSDSEASSVSRSSSRTASAADASGGLPLLTAVLDGKATAEGCGDRL